MSKTVQKPQPSTRHTKTIASLKQSKSAFYKNLGSIKSPALNNQQIIFNNYGWKHFRFDGKGHRRTRANISMRLNLLEHIPDVIKTAKTIIKESDGKVTIHGNVRNVKYYELAEECDGGKKHVTVIIRKIETGSLHYISVRRTSERIKRQLKNQKSP